MRERKQTGTIVQIAGRWYVRYWQRQTINHELVRKKVTHCLGPVVTKSKHAPPDIVSEAESYMATVNRSKITGERTVSLENFVEQVYLPWVEENKRPSTVKGYRDIWKNHLRPISHDRVLLKDVSTFMAQQWLNQIGKEGLGKNSLKHIQSVLSGIFTVAKRLGFFEGVNPVQDTGINPRAPQPQDTYAYSLAEVMAMLSVWPEPAATIFAVAAFAGLRHSEILGLQWPDLQDNAIWVSRSVWNNHVGEVKTRKSKAPVPVIKPLAERLEMHRLRCGNPETGPIFANQRGDRLNLNNVLRRVMLLTLARCRRCGGQEGKPHLKQDHDYERDPRLPEWHGWHAARRGLATNLYSLGVSDKTIQAILRHSNVAVTMGYYVKPLGEDVKNAMGKFEENFEKETAAQALRDSDRTLKPGSGAMPESVN